MHWNHRQTTIRFFAKSGSHIDKRSHVVLTEKDLRHEEY